MDYPHPYDNYFFDYDKIFPLKTINYEGIYFPCPNDTDFVLTQTFGDYMQLPKKIVIQDIQIQTDFRVKKVKF